MILETQKLQEGYGAKIFVPPQGSKINGTLLNSEAVLNDVCAYSGDVLTHVQQSTIMTVTQPPRLFTMRNLGSFLLPHYHNKHKGQ